MYGFVIIPLIVAKYINMRNPEAEAVIAGDPNPNLICFFFLLSSLVAKFLPGKASNEMGVKCQSLFSLPSPSMISIYVDVDTVEVE